MIIFYGRADDTPLARAVEVACELGVEHVLVDQGQLATADLWIEVGGDGAGGRLVVAGVEIDLLAVQGIYARPLEVTAVGGDPLDAWRARTFADGFLEWLDLAPGCMVLSLAPAMLTAFGSAVWWLPDWLATVLPHVDSEGEPEPPTPGPGPGAATPRRGGRPERAQDRPLARAVQADP